ncbi:MAG: hypothetical protein H6835_17325 [Planctomycetes bacterium]|nr:hypothetical protein [Planctomycetota bacterium]
MTPLHTVLSIALLWLCATGLGLLLLRRIGGEELRGLAIPTAVGLCVAAATSPSLFALGVPRAAVLTVTYIGALTGWMIGGADAVRAIDRRGVAAMLLTAAAFASPAMLALTSPTLFFDATLNWWPKVLEVASGGPSDFGPSTEDHWIPSYPRGFAWLCSVAVPGGSPTPQVMQAVTWLCTWTTALSMVAIARRHVGYGDAVWMAMLFALLPDVATHAGSGMVDPVIGMAVLVAAIGLSRREHADGALLASLGAAGAISCKVEGSVVVLVVLAVLVWDLVRRRPRRWRTLLGMSLLLIVVPATLARTSPASRVDSLGLLLASPDMLLLRCVSCLESIGGCLWPTAAFVERAPTAGDVSWSGWLVFACLAALAGNHRRTWFVAAPAWMLLPAAMAVYVTTGVPLRWHVITTLPRLMLEIVPTVLLAATIALRGDDEGDAPAKLSG